MECCPRLMRIGPLAFLGGVLISLSASAADWPHIALPQRVTGVTSPTHVTGAGDGSGRLFVVEQAGRVRIVKGGALLDAPFLDIRSRVSCCGERGLLSIAFSPRFAETRAFYLDYTDTNGDTVISRWRASAANPDAADGASEEVLLHIPQPFPNHNGGQLAFGPDGFLYIGMGDGGSAGDPLGNGQNRNVLLGKILRIDVGSDSSSYAIPPGNPFASGGGRAEVWDYGLRNPWRFSFDRATNDLYVADVGQDEWEEIDFEAAGSHGGVDYGWNVTEGNHCYLASSCATSGLTPPVAEYSHSFGCSVSGGFVYRGTRFPRLDGIYFYADYCTGRVWGLRRSGGAWQTDVLLQSGLQITSFGEDDAGEIWAVDQKNDALYQLVDPDEQVTRLTLPVVVDAAGKNGARFSTALLLVNRGTTKATVDLTYTAASAVGASGTGTVIETLDAGSGLAIADAFAYLRTKGLAVPTSGTQVGTLRVVFHGLSAPDAGFASARVTTPTGPGRAGVAFAALAPDETGAELAVYGLREDSASRSNLALVNTGDGSVTLRVTLLSGSGDGRTATLADVTLAPGAWTQLDSVLASAGMTNGFARVRRVGGLGAFDAYGVVNDAKTGDGSFLPAVAAGRAGSSRLVPVVVETPRFTSELVLTNPGDAPVEATLSYVESLASAGHAAGDVTVTLAAHEQRIVPGVLAFLRAQGASVGAAGGSFAGALEVRFTRGGAPATGEASARTSAHSADGGSFGVFTPAFTELETARSEAWVYGLEATSATRSNLAFVNAGADPIVVHYDLFDAATGARVGGGDVSLGAHGWAQRDSVLSGTGASHAYAHVQRTSGSSGFAAYGVVNDGATPGAGTDDGSYLAMAE